MEPKDLERLGQVSLFADLSADALRELTEGALLQRFRSETLLFRQGELPDFLHVLLEGSVQLAGASGDGRKTVVEILKPVDAFMPAAALTNKPYLVSAKVVDPARIVMLPAPALRDQITRDSGLSLAIIASLARQYRNMLRQVKDLKLRTSTQRLGCYLLDLDEEAGGNGTVELPHDKRLIAARLGMTPESLSRAFSALRKLGVEVNGHRVRLNDLPGLRQYCMPDRLIDGADPDLKVGAA
jgi:CRP/FNR family transcriptional regulator, transcriptional activator FtrB